MTFSLSSKPVVQLPALAQRVLNLIGFQIGWLAAVWAGARQAGWWAVAVVGLLAALHLMLVAKPANELKLMAAVAASGLLLDQVLAAAGFIRFLEAQLGLVPIWMVALWVNFSLTLNVSMSWLKGRSGLAALLGGIGGPLAYLAAEGMGAIEFPAGRGLALVALALGWALATPWLFWLARKFD